MDKVISELATIRTAVAYLGEAHQNGWWDSNFLSETGRAYLQYNFPRTYHVAGVHGGTDAAKKVHDQRIGRAQVRHLFRLGNSIDKLIHENLMQRDRDELLGYIESRDAALELLESMAEQRIDAPEGPIQVGKEKDIATKGGVAELAAHYLSGFEQGLMVLPFFGAKERDR